MGCGGGSGGGILLGPLLLLLLLLLVPDPTTALARSLLLEDTSSAWTRPGIPGFPPSEDEAVGSGVSGTVKVASCSDLQEAFKDTDVSKVVVVRDITCTRNDWEEPVMIHRNVDVVGLRIKGHTGVSRPASIDWSDVSKVVIAERGAVVFFHELVIYQAEMGIGGLNLPFIQTRRGATGVFAGMAVVVAACPQRVNLYDQLASELPRPEFLAGKQTTMAMDDESLLVKDVAIWWPNINSLWQICNTVFICGLTGPDSHRVARHFENMETMSRCETGEKLGDGEEEQARLELERRDKRKASMGMAATAIVIVVVVGVVLLATGGTTYYVCGRQKRALHLRNKDDQEGFKASKLNEKGAVTSRCTQLMLLQTRSVVLCCRCKRPCVSCTILISSTSLGIGYSAPN